jgi:CRP-like cAMP-binding protein
VKRVHSVVVVSRLRAAPEDIVWCTHALRALAPLEERELALVREALVAVDLAPGETYLRSGDLAEYVGIVRSGILREVFILADGSERTRGFAVVGDFAGSLADLLRGEAARTGVVCAVASRVLSLPWSRVTEAAAVFPGWKELLRRATERLYMTKAEREYELLGLDAEERYRRFRERHVGIEALVTQRHVASYLGITPEHLSRIRARQKKAAKEVKPRKEASRQSGGAPAPKRSRR